jgi:hypothetical protein
LVFTLIPKNIPSDTPAWNTHKQENALARTIRTTIAKQTKVQRVTSTILKMISSYLTYDLWILGARRISNPRAWERYA